MEKHFKDKLKNHKVNWDKEELLGSLEKELLPNKPRFIWKLLLLLPLLCISTCWGLYESDFSSRYRMNSEIVENSGIAISKIENSEIDGINRNQKNTETKTASNVVPIKPETNQLAKTDHSFASNNDKRKSEFLINTLSLKSALNPVTKIDKSDPTIFPNKKESILKSWAPQNKTSTAVTISQGINNNAVVPTTEVLSNKSSSKNSENQKSLKLIELLPSFEIRKISFEWRVPLILGEQKVDTFKPYFNKETFKYKNSFFISGSGDAGLIYRTTKFHSNNLDFVERLKKNEGTVSSRILLSTNLSIGYLHQSGWSLQSGLQYQEIKEFFKYDHLKTETSIELNEEAFYFLNQNADTLFFSDSSSLVSTEERKVRHWNKHAYFSIPIEVGYRYAIRSANIYGTVGISYAFAHDFEGRVNQLNEDSTNEIIDNPTFNFKSRIGYQLGLGAEYPIFRRTKFFIKISYRHSPKLTGIGKEQFYQSCSLGAGVRILIE